MMIYNSGGESIESVADWFRKAPPKSPKVHWQDGRSAKELAKAWFQSGLAAVPEEIEQLLAAAFPDWSAVEAHVENEVTLDELGGEQRTIELLVLGESGVGRVAISLDATADESFGDYIGVYYDRCKSKTASNVPARIEALLEAVLGGPLTAERRNLRYGLLHSTAAALVEARNCEAAFAVLLVVEFLSDGLNEKRVETNRKDYHNWVEALRPWASGASVAGLEGPFLMPGSGQIPADLPLFVGRVTVKLG
jgi:hypothetical protein